jgi:Uma2 family endonuclease
MADAAQRRMSVEEFLAWQGEGDTRYQLREGVPVAMAPPSATHRVVAGNLMGLVFEKLRSRPPRTVQPEAGLSSISSRRSFHQADFAVTCSPVGPSGQEIADPIRIVEVLSPSTADDDRRIKLPDYRMIPSVQEIVLIDSRFRYCEVHRRSGDDRWITDLLRRAEDRLRLETVGLDVALSEVYANVPLEEP